MHGARVSELKQLLKKHGLKVSAEELGPELRDRAMELCDGIVDVPHILGGQAFEDLPEEITKVVFLYDYVLHGSKGMTDNLRTVLKELLSTSSVAVFVGLEQQLMGAKTYLTGADYRLWVAAAPHLLESMGAGLPQRVEDLRQAASCLAQMNKWGLRLGYARWWNEQPRIVMRFTALAVK